ncbi:MAG: NAD(+)/NADH kinase, partial [Lachnospiraceae bacterium]|nr:NAD(+)/NADH kinase [Lachnospiraceae bacterium]
MIRKVYLIVNPKKDPSGTHRDRIREILREKGIEFVEAVPSGEDTGIRESEAVLCDAVFTVGGDGTLIQAARELNGIDKPFFAINIGTLGYLTETTMETAPEALDRLLA